MTDAVAAWIEAHKLVDLALQGAAISLAVLAMLAGLCGTAYLVLFLLRLTRKENRQKFVSQSIPAVLGGKFFGAEVNLGAVSQNLLAVEEGTVESLRGLEERVAVLEEAMERAEESIGNMEDVSGRLPGGTHGEAE